MRSQRSIASTERTILGKSRRQYHHLVTLQITDTNKVLIVASSQFFELGHIYTWNNMCLLWRSNITITIFP